MKTKPARTTRKPSGNLLHLQRDLSVALLAQDNLNGALQKLLVFACRVPGVDCGCVCRVDTKTNRADLLAHRGFRSGFITRVAHMAPDYFCMRLLLKGRPVFANGDKLAKMDADGARAKEGLRTLAILPQRHQGRVVASLNLGSHTVDRFPAATRVALESIAVLTCNLIARFDAQDAIRQAQQNLAMVFETMDDVLLILDASGKVLHTNRAAQQTLGYTAKQLARLNLDALPPPGRRKNLPSLMAELMAGRSLTIQAPLVCRNGQLVEMEIRMYPSQWNGQKAFFCIARDLNTRLQAEQELLRAEGLLQDIIQFNPFSIQVLDRDGCNLQVNPAHTQLFGSVPPAEFSIFDDIRKRYPEMVGLLARAQRGEVVNFPHILYNAHDILPAMPDRPVWVQSVMFPLRGPNRKPERFVLMHEDVTARKQAELALLESEQNFRNLAENSWYGILIGTADGRHVYANRRATELLGYTLEDLLQATQQEVVTPDEYPRIRQRMLARIAGQPAGICETVFRRKDGTCFPVESSSTQTLWRGQFSCMVFFHDISERKQMEREIVQISDWERTRIGQDLHDILGQQLTGLAYLSQTLARSWEKQSKKETDRATAQIATELRRAVEMVRQVAHGLAQMAPEPDGLADALRKMVLRTQQNSGVTCELQLDAKLMVPDRPTAAHLFLLAQEAVTNAVRHGQARQIVVRLARVDGQGNLTVLDNGVGMPVALPAGLGLGIMQYRANLIGGTLTIGRAEGSGTHVMCRFPLKGKSVEL